MVRYQLGQIEGGRETLDELRERVAIHGEGNSNETLGKETLALVGEAEALLARGQSDN